MNKSESIAKIALALSKAQGAIKAAVKDSQNPFYQSSYADMDSVIGAIKEQFSLNELAYSQLDGVTESGKLKITTLIMHSSGEWFSGETVFDAIPDAQKRKSAHTLLKRAALTAAVGLSEKDDDDGNASVEAPKKEQKKLPNYAPGSSQKPEYSATSQAAADAVKKDKVVTEAQLKRLFAIQQKSKLTPDDISKMIKMRFKKDSSKELTMSEYDEVISVIEANTEVK